MNSNTITEIKCLFAMIMEWFSYDSDLVEFVSIPIITNIIKNGNIDSADGSLIEAFFVTTGFIANKEFPEKLSQIYTILANKLEEYKNCNTPFLFRINQIIQRMHLKRPYSLKYI